MSQVQEEKTCLIAGLCDDEQYIHKVIEELLECYKTENNIDIQLIHYDSAEQLLDQRDELDFLLLDIEMPEMDGIGLGYKLKERNVKYKIIMLTAREDRFREAFKIGAFRFISKPVDKTELFEAIDAVRERIIVLQKVTVSRRLRKPLLNAYMEYDLRWR